MRRFLVLALLGLGVIMGIPHGSSGQDVSDFLPVGAMAPDIEVAGGTRHGVLAESVRLSDLRGETVVLAFFFKARTGG